MSGFVELIYNRYIRKYSLIITAIVILILFIIVGWYAYKKYYAEPKSKTNYADISNINTRGKPVEILFFFADWCPHCKAAKPIWIQFKEEYDGQTINGNQIVCRDIDCTDDTNDPNDKISAMISQYKVESFPTIIMLVGDNRIDFDAKITKSSLDQFVKSAIA